VSDVISFYEFYFHLHTYTHTHTPKCKQDVGSIIFAGSPEKETKYIKL